MASIDGIRWTDVNGENAECLIVLMKMWPVKYTIFFRNLFKWP